MSDVFDHDLIGYLLDSLEPDERKRIDAALAGDAALRERLDALRRGLAPLEDDSSIEPPEGLADRTCAFVANHATGPIDDEAFVTPRRQDRKSTREPLAPPARSWRGVDIAMALAVCVAGLALVLPLINTSRANSQVAICANKLREIGLALSGYSERNGGLFPQVPESGNRSAAGIYAPTLIDAGFLTEPRLVICPGSPLADI
jgi:anti-sigma-K factor RskA